jgi:WD40 repeat protein
MDVRNAIGKLRGVPLHFPLFVPGSLCVFCNLTIAVLLTLWYNGIRIKFLHGVIPMKRSLCATFVSLLFAVCLQAEEKPVYIELKGHTHGIVSAAFSPDGKKVITGSQDHTARIWDWERCPPPLPPYDPGYDSRGMRDF